MKAVEYHANRSKRHRVEGFFGQMGRNHSKPAMPINRVGGPQTGLVIFMKLFGDSVSRRDLVVLPNPDQLIHMGRGAFAAGKVRQGFLPSLKDPLAPFHGGDLFNDNSLGCRHQIHKSIEGYNPRQKGGSAAFGARPIANDGAPTP